MRTHVLILFLVAVKIAHYRFGFASIWPLLAFPSVPAFLFFFIELDLHLHRFCWSGRKTDHSEDSKSVK